MKQLKPYLAGLLVMLAVGIALPVLSPAQASESTIEPSIYVGKWYSPKAEKYRKCIVWRESKGAYGQESIDPNSTASGAYQFLNGTWTYYATKAGFPEWANKPAKKAPRYVQDAVFWRTWAFGNGKHHWSSRHGGYPCFPE